jgi:hypothetical protein
MKRVEQIVLAVVLVIAIAIPAWIYAFGVRPEAERLSKLRIQTAQAMRDRETTDHLLDTRQLEWSKLLAEIDRLRLFDLRKVERFETVMLTRSNQGLIALSEIFEKNRVAIDSLEPQRNAFRKVVVAGTPQAGVVSRRYKLTARGPYQGLLKVYEGFSALPPTLEIASYEVAYAGDDEQHAVVSLSLDLAFSFLVTPDQLERLESQEPQAEPGSTKTGRANGWRVALDWLMPPAWAQEGMPQDASKPYTIPVRKPPTLGRTEPFLPLAAAASAPSSLPTFPASLSKSAPRVTLIGVLLGGEGLPVAVVNADGQRLRVRPGSLLPSGSEVLAIGDGYILVRHLGKIHRISLSRDARPGGLPAMAPADSSDETSDLPPPASSSLPPPIPPLPSGE